MNHSVRLILAVICVAWARTVRAQEIKAFEAAIGAPNTFALAGPGIGFYPTNALKADEKVRVLREHSKDWLVIEPPVGSFSWVLAELIKEAEDGSGVVQVDGTEVFVGSTLIDSRHVSQVRLNKGDKVRILDRLQSQMGGRSTAWYKVVPPAKEVRYLAAASLKKQASLTPAESADYRSLIGPEAASATPAPAAAPMQRQLAATPVSLRLAPGTPVIPPAPPMRQVTTASRMATQPTDKSLSDKLIRIAIDDKVSPSQQLVSLKEQVGAMRSRLPETWDLPGAGNAARELSTKITDQAGKAQVAELREQIDRLGELKIRFAETTRRRELALQRDADLAAMQQRLSQQLGAGAPQFNAVGILRPAEFTLDGRTAYGLEGSGGVVSQYVVLSEGLKADRYLAKHVGILGRQVNRNDISKPLLIAEQINLISK